MLSIGKATLPRRRKIVHNTVPISVAALVFAVGLAKSFASRYDGWSTGFVGAATYVAIVAIAGYALPASTRCPSISPRSCYGISAWRRWVSSRPLDHRWPGRSVCWQNARLRCHRAIGFMTWLPTIGLKRSADAVMVEFPPAPNLFVLRKRLLRRLSSWQPHRIAQRLRLCGAAAGGSARNAPGVCVYHGKRSEIFASEP